MSTCFENSDCHIGASVDEHGVEIEVVVDKKKIFTVKMQKSAFSVELVNDAIEFLSQETLAANSQFFFSDDKTEMFMKGFNADVRFYSRKDVTPSFWFRIPLEPFREKLLQMFTQLASK